MWFVILGGWFLPRRHEWTSMQPLSNVGESRNVGSIELNLINLQLVLYIIFIYFAYHLDVPLGASMPFCSDVSVTGGRSFYIIN